MHVDGSFFPYLDEGSTPSGSTKIPPQKWDFFFFDCGNSPTTWPSLKPSTIRLYHLARIETTPLKTPVSAPGSVKNCYIYSRSL